MNGAVASLALQLRPPGHDPDHVRDVAREVLSRREYRTPAPSPLERLRAWVLDQLGNLFGALVSGDRASLLAWAILAAGAAVLVFFVVRFARGITPDAPHPSGAERSRVRRTGAEWRAEAADHERAGRWRLALRCRYRALVADLADRGLVEEIPGRTAGEYRQEVSRSVPAVAGEFSGATELFERAWYGNRPTGEPESREFAALADRVVAGAGR